MLIAVRIPEAFAELQAATSRVAGVRLVRCDDDAATVAALPHCDALVTSGGNYNATLAQALIAGPSRVRWIQFAAAGVDAAVRFGIPDNVVLTNAAAAIAPAVAEHAFALLLAGTRCIVAMDRVRATSAWSREVFVPRLTSIEGSTVLVLGYGQSGRELVRRSAAFGMRPIVVTRRPETVTEAGIEAYPLCSLLEALPRADVVILAIALTAGTRKLFGRAELAAMQSSAWLVNIARGAVVDQSALIDALHDRRIAGAALDVFEDEPLALDSPLRALDNAIITPHVAGFGSQATQLRLAAMVSDNIARFAAGEALTGVIAPEALRQTR